MKIIPPLTNSTFNAIATKTGFPVRQKKITNGTMTMTVSSNAALRTCIKQKMQLMTVIAM